MTEVRALPAPSSTGAGAFASQRPAVQASWPGAAGCGHNARAAPLAQRFHTVAMWRIWPAHATDGAAISQNASAQLRHDVYPCVLQCAVADAAIYGKLGVC
uniref:Uncharacterized protein n=1 Tax=Pelagomonas calceolata TaxID=35677 RepID=A0A7S3ZUI4_9STRA|mmetsp:Transcript_7875/g.22085  ORF Transcript_7875/g.22085 Transcript_7875/m.22085 type:complete len:101 (+) Transcript_7875:248-550(+)